MTRRMVGTNFRKQNNEKLSIHDSGASATELGLGTMVIMMKDERMMMMMVHLSIRSVSHRSRIEQLVTACSR